MIPSLFLAHGSPMLAVQHNEYTQFLKTLGEQYQPQAIVIFTAHWETDTLTISSSDDVYETIYDFYGFPDELYQVKYPARGSSSVAAQVKSRLEVTGIQVQQDMHRGLDHGSWTMLHRMYPKANIPVVQVSVNPFLSAAEQVKIGQALQGLGREDILIIGSGVTVHNLRMVKWGQATPEPWAIEFDDWLIDKLQSKQIDALLQYETDAPHARIAVPRPEHFVPLLITLGSGDSQSTPQVIHRSYEMGTLSYLCMAF